MPIQLTNAFNPGDLDPNKTYQQVKIATYMTDILGRSIRLCFQYGNMVDGSWVKGMAPDHLEMIDGQDFLDMVAEVPTEGETIYQATSRILYEYLIDKGIVSGTIV